MADRTCIIVAIGDRYQIAGRGNERVWHSAAWARVTYKHKLYHSFRCKDERFYSDVLSKLRTAKPDAKLLKRLQAKKAWSPPGAPTVEGMRKLLRAHPDTVILTCTRRGASEVQEMALRALFPRHPPLTIVNADVESNPMNYVEGELKPTQDLVCSRMPVYKGTRIMFTRNVRRDIDFINGMKGIVEKYDRRSRAIVVMTESGHPVEVYPWTDRELGDMTYYPVVPGYAGTILKYQGAELKHVVAYLDAPGIPGIPVPTHAIFVPRQKMQIAM